MSNKFYPAVSAKAEVQKLDEAVVAERIITARENGQNKSRAIGEVLQGSDDVETFNKVWDKVEAERLALRAVSGKDKTEYAAEVAKVAVYADPVKWTAEAEKAGLIGIKAVEEVIEPKVIEGK